MFVHAAVQGLLATTVALFLASSSAWDAMARTSTWVLNTIGVRTTYESVHFVMYVNLPAGSIAGFQVLAECSGLLTIVVFSFISVFTIGLLRGALSTKLIWFALSLIMGFAWNINRLVLVVTAAHYFGLATFSFMHFILAPTIDFIWVVSMWSFGMSRLKRGGKRTL